MDVLTSEEIDDLVNSSDLVKKYKNEVDKESAYEILAKRIEQSCGSRKRSSTRKIYGKTTQRRTGNVRASDEV